MKRLLLVLSILFVVCHSVWADYLVLTKAAGIKDDPSPSGTPLENAKEGDHLVLLDGGVQSNGYYKVLTPSGVTGWVYRTMVRRYTGSSSTSSAPSPGSTAVAGGVEVTVVDVGAGLSCIARLPKNKYIIYDAGRTSAMVFYKKYLPAGSEIELLILSHTDADHWGAVEQLVKTYRVKRILRTSYRINEYSPTYISGVNAIKDASYPIDDINLSDDGDITPGDVLYNGDGVKLVAICGFGKPLTEWGKLSDSKANNAVSIMARLEFAGHSVLFGGDAVGREDCATDDRCIATEQFLVQHSSVKLKSDVIIAPHHGADNASCQTFIEKVSPEYVVFSSGHAFRHPREATAERYIGFGVDPDNIFRTDLGDYEVSQGDQCKNEWTTGAGSSNDTPGDDNVRIVLPKSGKIKINYIK